MTAHNFIEGTRLDNRLPALLGERKISIRELSRQTGVTYSMLWDVYHGERQSIKYEVLDAICRVLDVQPGNIFIYVGEDMSNQAEENLQRAQQILVDAIPKVLHAYHEILLQFIEEYHEAREEGDKVKAEKVRRKLEREAKRLRRYEDPQNTAGSLRELLNERKAPAEWHELAKQVLPGY